MSFHRRIYFLSSLLPALAAVLFPSFVFAANLYISPASGTWSVGDTFKVAVDVSSTDQAMNAANVSLGFDADKLSIESISKASSILTYWVVDPSFSNSAGTASAQGVVTNPGFTGSAGNIVTITFKAVGPGTASVTLNASSQVLANDGNGTNILTKTSTAIFTIVSASSAPAPAPKPKPVRKPPRPKILPDTTPPEPFTITFPEGMPTENPAPPASFSTTDADSGMDHYEYSIDAGPYIPIDQNAHTEHFIVPPQKLGTHTLAVRAFDMAGNTRDESASFTIIPPRAPVLTKYPESVQTGTPFEIGGTSAYPGAAITLAIRDHTGATVSTKKAHAGDDGAFAAVVDETLARGMYKITASLVDTHGAASEESAPVAFSVTYNWLGIAWIALNVLTLILLGILMLFGIYSFLLWFAAWKKKRRQGAYLRRLRRDTIVMDKALDQLDTDMELYAKYLQRIAGVRKLTAEEQALLALYNEKITLETLRSGVSTMDAVVGVRSKLHRRI